MKVLLSLVFILSGNCSELCVRLDTALHFPFPAMKTDHSSFMCSAYSYFTINTEVDCI